MKQRFVLSLTPSPTLDLGGVVDRLVPNEKCYVHDQTKSAGGNGINAARILTRLGIPTVASGFLGGGVGEEILSLLKAEGVRCNFVPIQGHSRISVVVSNLKDHQQTRLSFPGPQISSKEGTKLFDSVETSPNLALVILGGSLPTGFEVSRAKKILKIANKRGIPCIVDCPGSALRELVEEKPFFIKPNLTEFHEAFGVKSRTIHSIEREARKLLIRVPFICVSSVEGGALFITRQNSFFGQIPPIKIKSTVGAGDSMVGAMAAQFFAQNRSNEDIFRWGLAAAAATLSHPGTTLGARTEIKNLYPRVSIKQIF